MIIYGSRMYGRKNVVEGWGHCKHCGVYGRQTTYTGRKWGHIYFIPLIPEGPVSRVFQECCKCSYGSHIPEKNIADILGSLEKSIEKAMTALDCGEKDFKDEGETSSCAGELTSAAQFYLWLGEQEKVDKIMSRLLDKDHYYASFLVKGELMEFHGNLKCAADAYRDAANHEPEEDYPLLALGSTLLELGNAQNAIPVYEQALKITKDKLTILQIMLSIYQSLKDHVKTAEMYERCLSAAPELSNDKKFVKAYRKACKKASRTPII